MAVRSHVYSLAVVWLGLTSVVHAETLSSCVSACYPSPTEDCFKLNGNDANHTVSQGFKWLFAQFSQAPSRLKKADLQQQFGVSEDSCERGDTLIEPTSIANDGPNKCIIATTVEASGMQISAGIVVPSKLEATWEKTTDGAITLSLDKIEFQDRPYLGISNKYLQEAWGGLISAAQFKDTTSVLVTTNGCLRYDY